MQLVLLRIKVTYVLVRNVDAREDRECDFVCVAALPRARAICRETNGVVV